MPDATVAIPVRDGGELLARTLRALAGQTVAHELLVCDSGSRDGSAALARAHGARVIEIEPREFGHGATRNLLLREAAGAHVALLTQDAEPADGRWLERLLGGFELAPDVALVYGPYRPRPEASVAVRLELERWFRSLAPDGEPTVERLAAHERGTREGAAADQGAVSREGAAADQGGVSREGEPPPARSSTPVADLVGRRGFFTDANACIARAAWERVPFRAVGYAEDRVLAIDMLRAGHAKAFVPAAAVWHSHEYSALQQLRRCFDEWRGLREVYGWREPADPRSLARGLRGELGAAWRELAAAEGSMGADSAGIDASGDDAAGASGGAGIDASGDDAAGASGGAGIGAAAGAGGGASSGAAAGAGLSRAERLATLAAVSRHHVLRSTGAVLGSRADRLPPRVRRELSLERRAGFAPLAWDAPAAPPGAGPGEPSTENRR